MAPKFQKGPDLKRFMVSLDYERIMDVLNGIGFELFRRLSHHAFVVATQDKRMQFLINGNRRVIGTLRGYDAFLNVVLEDAQQVTKESTESMGQVVIRGNSIIQFEGLERVATAAAVPE